VEFDFSRKDFDYNLYKSKDYHGKVLTMKILAHSKLFISGKFKILDPFENRKCGDIKIQYTLDNSILDYEVECAGFDRFDKNFKGLYSTVNVPMKKLESIPNGYFIAVDDSEPIETEIPKRFYIIKVEDILNSEKKSNVNKFSNGKQEYFFKVPSVLVERYEWNAKKGKYIRVYP
jgi:hypothetical protein